MTASLIQKLAAYECEVAQLKCQVTRYQDLIVALTSGGEISDIDRQCNHEERYMVSSDGYCLLCGENV